MDTTFNIKEKLPASLTHLLLSFLLSVGLLMPLLSILDMASFISSSLLLSLVCLLVMEAAALNRISAIGLSALGVLAGFGFLLSGGGSALLTDILRALTLHVNGLPVTLVLVGRDTALLLTLVLTVLVFLLTLRPVGSFPALLLCLGMLFALWFKRRPDLLLSFLPAVAATLALVLVYRHNGTSMLRVLPWSALLVLAAYLLTPMSGAVIPEWKNKADELRQSITDTLFFTDPRNVFSISADGFYPQGINQLGGLVEPSDRPVMQVSTPEKIYLRGAVMNEYTGRSWKNTTGGRRYLWNSGRWASLRSSVFNETLPAPGPLSDMFRPVTVSVRLVRDSASTLFLPQRVRELRPGGSLIPYFNMSSEVFITRDLQVEDTYTVSGLNYIAGDPGLSTLIDACAQLSDPEYASVLETYTVLPSHLESVVYDLARSVTSDGLTPYAKAFNLQNWLSRGFRYTLNVADQPEDRDFVTHFLLTTKEGYCTYFASAMTVMCRMIGLPARYVEGYVAEPDETGNATVTGLNAHAWTEVYFSGLGWVTFDATPRTSDSGEEDPPAPPTPTPEPPAESTPENPETPTPTPPSETPVPSEEPDSSPTSRPSGDPVSADAPAFPWWLLLVLALILTLTLRIVLTEPRFREKKTTDLNGRWLVYVHDVLDLLRVRGLVPGTGETPMSFMRRCDRECVFSTSLDALGQCISLICYAHVEPVETDIELFRFAAENCRSELTFAEKIRYFLIRSFVPRKKRNFYGL